VIFDIYSASDDEKARYFMGKSGSKKLFVFGLNPSTADQENSDLTATKVEAVAKKNGFDGFVLFNLYPLRSTDPKKLPKKVSKFHLKQNLLELESLLSSSDGETCFWAAWGSNINLRPYLAKSLKQITKVAQKKNCKWLHYGKLTKEGHPRHPSRLSYSWEFSEFPIQEYLSS